MLAFIVITNIKYVYSLRNLCIFSREIDQ